MESANSVLAFYQDVMRRLAGNGIEFLVGGGYAFGHYTGLQRDTKDFDLMVRPSAVPTVINICQTAGYQADYAFSHWLAKICGSEGLVDIIFRSSNGLCEVDDEWFAAAPRVEILDTAVRLVRPEEMIWQKAYVMERERFDGADIAHLLASCGEQLSWKKLLLRFGPDWRVLLSHLALFAFIYPAQRRVVPRDVLSDLISRLINEEQKGSGTEQICNGTLLSRREYRYDVIVKGLQDARLNNRCRISQEELNIWDNASPEMP
jgi:Nucleotidyl transferase of unknown function (DUF2204)